MSEGGPAFIAAPQIFTEWLAAAPAGEQLLYHDGFLAVDREKDEEVEVLAREVWAAQEAGFVLLTQERESEGIYAYLATRTGELV